MTCKTLAEFVRLRRTPVEYATPCTASLDGEAVNDTCRPAIACGICAGGFSARKFDLCAERVEYASERLGRDFDENLTAYDLAREDGMSMFRFTRIFSELFGAPPAMRILSTNIRPRTRALRPSGFTARIPRSSPRASISARRAAGR